MKLTVFSLIYASPAYAIGFYEHLKRVTPELSSTNLEFYYVANNASKKVIQALTINEIPYKKFQHKASKSRLKGNDYELVGPKYLSSVYAAYNFGITQASFENILLLNSDMVMSPGWYSKICQEWDQRSIISPGLVERWQPRFGVFDGAISRDFGSSFENFDWENWVNFCEKQILLRERFQECKPFMPALVKKNWLFECGMFPEGNVIIRGNDRKDVKVAGDQVLYDRLEKFGISHITSTTTFCYHFKEGERSSTNFGRMRAVTLNWMVRMWHRIKLDLTRFNK